MSNRTFKGPAPGMNQIEMTADSVVIMELSEEMRYLKREIYLNTQMMEELWVAVKYLLPKGRLKVWKQQRARKNPSRSRNPSAT